MVDSSVIKAFLALMAVEILLNLIADLVVLALDPTVAQRGRSTSRPLGRAG